MELKFSFTEIAFAVQTVGLIASAVGYFIAYILLQKFDFFKIIFFSTILQPFVISLFILQNKVGHYIYLIYIVSFTFFFLQELTSSIKLTYIAKVSKASKDVYFYNAFLHSLFTIGQLFFSTISGFVVDKFGWVILFKLGICLSIFPIIMIIYIGYRKIDIMNV